MSTTTVYHVNPQHELQEIGSLRNSYGSMPAIYAVLGAYYLGAPVIARSRDDFQGWEQVWALHRDPRITREHWLVLRSTFTGAWIDADTVRYYAAALQSIQDLMPFFYTPRAVNHLPELIELAKGCADKGLGLAVDWTSLSSSQWPENVVDPERRVCLSTFEQRNTRYVLNGPVPYMRYASGHETAELISAWRAGMAGQPFDATKIAYDRADAQAAYQLGLDDYEWRQQQR